MVRRVCYPFVGDTIGGSHMSALLLIEHLDRRRYEPIIAVHESGPFSDFLRQRGLPFTLVPVRDYAGSTPSKPKIALAAIRAAGRLRKFVRDNRIAIVHGNDLRTNLTWSLGTRAGGAKLLWHQRTLPRSRSPIWRLVAVLANRVAFTSLATRDGFPLLGKSKAVVIANPFDTGAKPPDRKVSRADMLGPLGIDPGAAVIGYVGRFGPQKRSDLFVDIAARIARGLDRETAFVVLSPDDEQGAARLSRRADALGIGANIHFVGFKSPVEPWLAALDLLVAPAVDDGFGRAIVESMLVGTPVVAANSGGHPEIIESEKNGILVDPDDPDSHADAACRILGDSRLAKKLAWSARNDARRRYSAAGHADAVMRLYDSMVEKRGAHGGD